ncbi:hypothetical protein M5689_000514 [Euphorbia peplus]|nr:hypothetical protein M5689_000514 [Euphorbia peplus]
MPPSPFSFVPSKNRDVREEKVLLEETIKRSRTQEVAERTIILITTPPNVIPEAMQPEASINEDSMTPEEEPTLFEEEEFEMFLRQISLFPCFIYLF